MVNLYKKISHINYPYYLLFNSWTYFLLHILLNYYPLYSLILNK